MLCCLGDGHHGGYYPCPVFSKPPCMSFQLRVICWSKPSAIPHPIQYRSSPYRFNLYLLLICVGVFSYYFYYRRGKAFIMAVKEASRTRRARLAYTADSLSFGSIPPSHATLGETVEHPDGGIIHKPYPAFAPSGAIPATDSSVPSMARSQSGGQSIMAASSSSRGVTGLFRKSWFTPAYSRRSSDAMASGSSLVEEGGPASYVTGESYETAKNVLLRPITEMEAGNDTSLFDVGHDQDGSVQQSKVLKMPKWTSPWRRVVGKGDSEDTALVRSSEGGRSWVTRLSTWSSE